MIKKSILILLDNPFTNDRRVHREARTLSDKGFDITLLATQEKGLLNSEVVESIKVHRIFKNDIFDIKKSSCFKNYAKSIVSEFDFEKIHANDQTMLHLAIRIKKIKPETIIVYDSHELFRAWPLNTSVKGVKYLKSLFVRWWLKRREARNIKEIDGLVTVNESIRLDLIKHFKLNIPTISVRNIPEVQNSCGRSGILRKKFGLAAESKILVYIGAHIYPRSINIEQVISEFANKANVFMVFICKFNWGKDEIEAYSKSIGVKNLFFHDLIPPEDINLYLADADAGIVSSWNKKDLSYWYGLDNKLFEYMMAEIPIVATRQPEYIKIVEEFNIGICINPEIESYFSAFEAVCRNQNMYRQNIIKAKKSINWENESEKLVEFYSQIR